jgi:hypothetical protein
MEGSGLGIILRYYPGEENNDKPLFPSLRVEF